MKVDKKPASLPPWALANYQVMRAALGAGVLTAEQERYLRWLSQWDEPTTRAMVSLFRFAGGER